MKPSKLNFFLAGCLCIAGLALASCSAPQPEQQTTSEASSPTFDSAAARMIVEKRCAEFEEALRVGDSLAVGDIYTLDTKIVGHYTGRENIIKEVHEMYRDSMTGIKFRVVDLWGSENVIVEDAFVEFYHANGTLLSKGDCLLVWKKEEDKWRIFRDVYKPVRD